MKSLKVIDLVMVGLFVVGIALGITQTIQTESTSEEIIADVNPQFITLNP